MANPQNHSTLLGVIALVLLVAIGGGLTWWLAKPETATAAAPRPSAPAAAAAAAPEQSQATAQSTPVDWNTVYYSPGSGQVSGQTSDSFSLTTRTPQAAQN